MKLQSCFGKYKIGMLAQYCLLFGQEIKTIPRTGTPCVQWLMLSCELLQDVDMISQDLLILIRLVYPHMHSRRAQYVMLKFAVLFLVAINPAEGLAGNKVSNFQSTFVLLFMHRWPCVKQTVCIVGWVDLQLVTI